MPDTGRRQDEAGTATGLDLRAAAGSTGLAVAAVVALLTAGLLGGGLVAPAAGSPHGSPANMTINPVDERDHFPGVENASYQTFSTGRNATDQDIERLAFASLTYAAADLTDCSAFSTAVFGIDRGNDDPGTITDESLVDHTEDSSRGKHTVSVDFYEEGDLGGSTVGLNRDDQLITYDKDCYTNPSEPGWYRFQGVVRGEGTTGETVEIRVDSHYFYICRCANRSEAVRRLGPPPGQAEGTATPRSAGTTTPPATATTAGATPTHRTTTSRRTATGTGLVATSTVRGTPTRTAGAETPTAPSRSGTTTTAPGNTAPGTAATATGAPTPTADGSGEGGATTTGGAGVTGGGTPTGATGPGLGVSAALAGLAATVLLLRRRHV